MCSCETWEPVDDNLSSRFRPDFAVSGDGNGSGPPAGVRDSDTTLGRRRR
jgi:hypothetical protein